jgi:large subunit ribosomal protein L30
MPEKSKAGTSASRTKKTAKKATKKTTTKTAAPKRAAKPKAKPTAAPVGGKLRVKQVRSGIGHAATYRRTLRALGIKHHQDEVVVPDNPSVRGMVFKVRHLVQVTSEEA